MLIRWTSNIIRAIVRAVGILLLIGVIAFFAATRTQVGRDSLARQLETEFNSRYHGELHIENMTGNLARTMYVSGITVTDGQGHPLIEVDSIVVAPRWSALWSRKFSIRSLELRGVRVHLLHDGLTSNVQDIFRSDGSNNPWTVQNATLRAADVSISARRTGNDPPPGWFSWLEEHPVVDIETNVNIAWSPRIKQADLLSFTAAFPRDDLTISTGRSQLIVSDDQLRLTELFTRIGQSTVEISGTLDRSQAPLADRIFQLEVQSSVLNLDELSRMVPSVALSGTTTVAAMLQGPFSDMTVSWLRARTAESSAELSGTIKGLPRTAQFEMSATADRVQVQTLRTMFRNPSVLDDLLIPEFAFESYMAGYLPELSWPATTWPVGQHANGNMELRGSGNGFSLSFNVQRPTSNPVRHHVQARTNQLDLGLVFGDRSLSTIVTGTLNLTGTGITPQTAVTEAIVSLSGPEWNGRSADRMTLTAFWDRGMMTAQSYIHEGPGNIDIRASGRILPVASPMRFDVELEHANVGPLFAASELTTDLNLQLSGTTSTAWDDAYELSLDAVADSSRITLNDSTQVIAPQRLTFLVRPPGQPLPLVEFRSSTAAVTIASNTSAPDLTVLANAWYHAVRYARQVESNKWLERAGSPPLPYLNQLAERELMDAIALESARIETQTAEVSFSADIAQTSLLNAMLPDRPFNLLSGSTSGNVTVSADSIALTFTGTVQELNTGTIHADNARVSVTVQADRSQLVSRSAQGVFTASLDSLSMAGLNVRKPELSMVSNNGTTVLDIRSSGIGRTDSMHVRADFVLGESANRLEIRQATLQIDESEWMLSSPSIVSFFANAASVSPTVLGFRNEGQLTGQRIRAEGTLSSAANDSLRIGAENVVMSNLSDFLGLRFRIGGLLNTGFVLTGGMNRPQLSGSLELKEASVGRHVVGDLFLETQFLTGTPDIQVDARITPLASTNSGLLVQNDLRLNGTVRLPGLGVDDHGDLNLNVDLERVDMFFLEYIFNTALTDVGGFAVGDGTVRGPFNKPVISVNAGILDGSFYIPKTELSYAMSGDIRIDEEAIHIARAEISDRTGGRALLNGRLNFNDYREFTLDLAGRMTDLKIIGTDNTQDMPFYGHIWASGTLTLSGPLYGAVLRSSDAVTRADSRIFIPIEEEVSETDESFIVFEDSLGVIPDFRQLSARTFLLARRSATERQFLDALEMDLNIQAPPGSMVHLVIDPLLGDVISASSSGNIQLVRENDQFSVFGQLQVASGDYLFTAGEVFQRKFFIQNGGTMTWDGDPLDATLDILGTYRTRASLAGLSNTNENQGLVPLIVQLHITGTVSSPDVDLSLAVDRSNQNVLGDYQALEARLNRPDRATEYATSVLLTNSFQLTTENISTESGGQLAFNSVSQLVSAQLNRFLNAALPNVEFNFGLQGETAQDLDVTYGVALRLRDERLIIRGEGVYQGTSATDNVRANDGLQGEFVVEVRLSPHIAIEVFYRREGDILQRTELTNTGGVGLSYQTDFTSWRRLFTGQ